MATTTSENRPARSRPSGRTRFLIILFVVPVLLFVVPAWRLLGAGADWPAPVGAVGTALFALALVGLPTGMLLGHGPRQLDAAARLGDLLLGSGWVLFVWTLFGEPVRLVLALAGLPDPTRARVVAVLVLAVVTVLLAHAYRQATRVPRVVPVEVRLDRLGAGLDGLRVALISDTHFGPMNRRDWGERVVAKVNDLNPDIVCHAGDLADGLPDRRAPQVAALANVRAELGRFYIVGNHEHFAEARAWLDHMRRLGWHTLHNRHEVVSLGGDQLVVAGIDDPTGVGSAQGPDLPAALAGSNRELPVLLLAHQPRQVTEAAEAGVDLQLSGHTHGGQIWPFHYLVRTDQPVLAGLSRHGARTQLYTSRGTGFWGPPLRLFAPSEITLITLRGPVD